MTTPVSVSDNDFHTLMRIVKAPDLGADGDGLPWSTLHGLKELIACDAIAFNGIDPHGRRFYLSQNTVSADEPELPGDGNVFWAHYRQAHASYPDRSGDLHSVTKVTDFSSMRQYRQTPIYTDFFGLRDQEHKMLLCLPDGPGRTLRLILFRGRGTHDYTERDRSLLILLRPHLQAAHVDLRRRKLGIPDLTPRQWELLLLVDEGLSNTQIGRRLVITENTVRKHMENIFQRLHVSSRTAALARAFPDRTRTDGPLRPRHGPRP